MISVAEVFKENEMTVIQYCAIVALLGISIIKPFLYKPLAEKYPASFASELTVSWLMPFILLSFPFMYPYLIDALPAIKAHPVSLILTVFKGVFIWYAYEYAQIINRDSTSSTVFFPFISLAAASLIINLFFHENLALIHLLSIVSLGILGLVFCFAGDAKRMSHVWKINFAIAIFFSAICPIIDHIAITDLGRYTYFIISNLVMFIFAFFRGLNYKRLKLIFTTKDVIAAGIVGALLEITIIGVSVYILPISFTAFFRRMAAPIVMVISAIKYKEQTVRNQLIFGCLALLFALPIILMK